jgi:DMSO reductase iron-sulfur subunit
MRRIRDDEPANSFVPASTTGKSNRYGKPVDLVDRGHPLAGKSLNINGDSSIGSSPDRYKQHGFYFNADNCIACHACESACSEKNNLAPHLAFRSVGYVEGGSWPDYHRLNISMACNHCDDPVCLKGCPTRAYTKFAEYGAVLQDPDICFGCGYCTWVCPYNAPQLDPVQGNVEKCNMCVDRLEQGLKPACASACLAGALDFGVIETLPENRTQLEVAIPGFPSPEITHPNIRFQQMKKLPQELTRPDSMPVRYVREGPGSGAYRAEVRQQGSARRWHLGALSSRENPLVGFTLLTQLAVGGFLFLFALAYLSPQAVPVSESPWPRLALVFGLAAAQALGLALSAMHLGKPHRFYRGFNNLRYSPVSREAAGIVLFLGLLGCYGLLSAAPLVFGGLAVPIVSGARAIVGWGTAAAGALSIYLMYRAYRIPARPYWDHWQTLTAFLGNSLTLGSLAAGLVYAIFLQWKGVELLPLWRALAWPVVAGFLLETAGLYFHARSLKRRGGEGAASHHEQSTRFGKTYLARNVSLPILALLMVGSAVWAPSSWLGAGILLLLLLLTGSMALVSRAMFYVLVIPTTMPGAFFWRNQGFREHARHTGLADLPQSGVLADTH